MEGGEVEAREEESERKKKVKGERDTRSA